jgi:hypothetical protein
VIVPRDPTALPCPLFRPTARNRALAAYLSATSAGISLDGSNALFSKSHAADELGSDF